MQTCANLVDLEKSCKLTTKMQNSASIQPSTSHFSTLGAPEWQCQGASRYAATATRLAAVGRVLVGTACGKTASASAVAATLVERFDIEPLSDFQPNDQTL